jgi:hypothetical protein
MCCWFYPLFFLIIVDDPLITAANLFDQGQMSKSSLGGDAGCKMPESELLTKY